MFIPFLPFLLAFSLLQTASAAPGRISIPRVDPKTILCSLQFAKPFLCPQGGLNQYSRVTPLGTATGVMDADGAIRYSLKYANAARWAPSTLVNTWSLPNGGNDVNALPLACPQPDIPASSYTEDCLSMVLYVPPNMAPLSNAPVMVWIHGGSFTIGSASEAGLDGSKLAIATNSIVAVVQYRLGALGFLAPNGQTNLALKDVVNALQFLKNNVAAFGGSPSKITVAGQSSGATMIRALLGVPSASSLFRSAILQSDAMNFGMLRPENQQNLMTEFKAWIGCDSAACQDSLALEDIVLQGSDMQKYGGFIDPAAGHGQPVRPVLDDYLTNPVEPGGTFPSSVNKPLMITTVLNEGTFPIYGAYQNVVPVQDFPPACAATFGPDRTTTIIDAPYYTPTPAFIVGGVQDARGQLDLLATDYLYKCSGWTFGRRWSGSGGQVFIGEYVVGSAYPANAAVSFCSKPGVVCHQDDIQIVFGTAPSPSPAQAALITEMQKRYASFLNNGNPNAPGLTTWQPATSSDARALKLGGAGSVPVGACTPSFWGSAVQYDYQFYYQ